MFLGVFISLSVYSYSKANECICYEFLFLWIKGLRSKTDKILERSGSLSGYQEKKIPERRKSHFD